MKICNFVKTTFNILCLVIYIFAEETLSQYVKYAMCAICEIVIFVNFVNYLKFLKSV